MKNFYRSSAVIALLTVITSCGREAAEGVNAITVGEVRTSRDAFFNQQDLNILHRVCSALRVKDAFFETYYLDKNRSINTDVVTKECEDEVATESTIPLKLESHLSRIVYTGPSAGEFFSEYESLKTGVFSELCRKLELGGQISSTVSVSGSSYMQWYSLSDKEEVCMDTNSACLFIELGARESNSSMFKVQQNERITINLAKGTTYGFPVFRERIDNAFCNSSTQYRHLKNTYRY